MTTTAPTKVTQDIQQISRKMLNHLSCAGIAEAKELLSTLSAAQGSEAAFYEDNRPLQKTTAKDLNTITDETYQIAAEHLGEEGILSLIQIWIKEDRVNFLLQTWGSPRIM